MTTPEPSDHATERLKFLIPEEVEEIYSKRFIMKIIEALKQNVKNSLKEMEKGKQNGRNNESISQRYQRKLRKSNQTGNGKNSRLEK